MGGPIYRVWAKLVLNIFKKQQLANSSQMSCLSLMRPERATKHTDGAKNEKMGLNGTYGLFFIETRPGLNKPRPDLNKPGGVQKTAFEPDFKRAYLLHPDSILEDSWV